MSDKVAVVVLAAGKGTRMKSKLPKVLHKIGSRSMIEEVLATANKLNPEKVIVVVGYEAEKVKAILPENVTPVIQSSQLGTGHAMKQAIPELEGFHGHVVTLYGDVPLLTAETLKELLKKHKKSDAAVTVLTAKVDDPTGYGRVVRNGDSTFFKIVEHKDASQKERKINEINSGVYCFTSDALHDYLPQLTPQNKQGEYYLTDVLALACKDGKTVEIVVTNDPIEISGVNDRKQLADLFKVKNERKLNKLMRSGVTVIDPNNTYIDDDVEIGMDTTIEPGTILLGKCQIGSNVIIGPYTTVVESDVLDHATVERSVLEEVIVKSGAKIGPFLNIKKGSTSLESSDLDKVIEFKN